MVMVMPKARGLLSSETSKSWCGADVHLSPAWAQRSAAALCIVYHKRQPVADLMHRQLQGLHKVCIVRVRVCKPSGPALRIVSPRRGFSLGILQGQRAGALHASNQTPA